MIIFMFLFIILSTYFNFLSFNCYKYLIIWYFILYTRKDLTELLRMKINEERKERELESSDDTVRMNVPVLTSAHPSLVRIMNTILLFFHSYSSRQENNFLAIFFPDNLILHSLLSLFYFTHTFHISLFSFLFSSLHIYSIGCLSHLHLLGIPSLPEWMFIRK